uniref:Uncharacterized protein n=1 Tax=Strigops habroptila TaxID=2489341 RepID=A0A672V517_STRHB
SDCQRNLLHGPWSAHPEVLGVHVQFVAVEFLRQLGIGRLKVFQVLDGIPEGGEHLLAVGTDLGVADDGRGAGQIPEVVKEPLGPGVDNQQPAERWRNRRHKHINAPEWKCRCASLSMVQVPGAGPTWPGPRHRIPPR